MKEQNVVVTMLLDEKRNKVAEIIQTARVQKGFSQQQLADRVNVSANTISRIEIGKFSPNADLLYLILDCLDLPLTINSKSI